MRSSTAGTLALTVLLVTSLLGAVVAAPSAAALDATQEPTPTADDRVAAQSIQPTAGSPSAAVTTAAQTQAPPSVTDSAPQPALAANSTAFPPGDPEQVFRIEVTEDGHAEWTVEFRFNVTDDNADTFTEWGNAVAAGDRGIDYESDIEQFRLGAANAERATGRQMAIEDPGWNEPRVESSDRSAETQANETYVGVISYSFTWTNFARVDDNRIYIGDVFHAPEDPMLPNLYTGQRLVIKSPSNYALETPTPLSWDGPHQFADGELEIVFVRGAVPGAGWLWAAGGIGLALAGAVAGYLVYQYRRDQDDVQLPGPIASLVTAFPSDDPSPDAGSSAQADDSAPQSDPEAAAEAGTQVAFEEDEEIDPELLSDEERVHRMLERNGGRMKQANIVKETGWSNAKVSQLLSQMDDDGKIEKLRIGRENLITLPEVDPTEVD